MKSEQNLYMKIHDIIELIKEDENESVIIKIHDLMRGEDFTGSYTINRDVLHKLRRVWYLIDAGIVQDAINDLRMFQLQYLSRLQERNIRIAYIAPGVTVYAHWQLQDWMFKNNTYHIKGQ